MAATSAAWSTKSPAPVAWAPVGETKTTTGSAACSRCCTTCRVALSYPALESRVSTAAGAPARSAPWITCCTWRAVPALITPEMRPT